MSKARIAFVLSIVGLSGILYGIGSSGSAMSVSLPYLRETTAFTSAQLSLLVGACMLGAVVSGLFAGPLADWIGRKRSFVVAAALFAAGSPALALSNGLVALSGALMSQYQGFADINMGRGAIVIGLAAVIIGEATGRGLLGKRLNFYGRMAFTVIGGIMYYLVVVVVLWLKLNSNDLKLITAIIVALFLALPYLREKRKVSFRHARKEGAKHAEA